MGNHIEQNPDEGKSPVRLANGLLSSCRRSENSIRIYLEENNVTGEKMTAFSYKLFKKKSTFFKHIM